MSHHSIRIVQEFACSVDELFAQFSDHDTLGKILGAPIKRIKQGADSQNGVGSVRRVGLPGVLGLEETIQFLQRDALIEYKITKGGGPIRNHYGRQVFSPTSKGSRLEWTISFDSIPWVGDGAAAVVKRSISHALERHARKSLI